jgi:thiol-disulfide isomerase/thioredoxin
MKPVVDRLKQEYEGKVEFRIYDVEKSSEGEELMRRYGAQYVPTFVFLNSDGIEANRAVGEVSEDEMREMLDALE